MIFSNTLFKKNIDKSKFNNKKFHSFSDILIHHATVVEYNSDSKFKKIKKSKNQKKPEFRTVDNLILASYNSKYHNIYN